MFAKQQTVTICDFVYLQQISYTTMSAVMASLSVVPPFGNESVAIPYMADASVQVSARARDRRADCKRSIDVCARTFWTKSANRRVL
jgi:hypothetical protein